MIKNWSQLKVIVQHENQNMSNKLKEVERDVKKTENLQQEYVKFN